MVRTQHRPGAQLEVRAVTKTRLRLHDETELARGTQQRVESEAAQHDDDPDVRLGELELTDEPRRTSLALVEGRFVVGRCTSHRRRDAQID
jgi:hypothetical protein